MNLNMNSAESLVAQIQGLSGNIADLTQLRSYLNQSYDLLRAESTRFAPLLNELDPSIHSLGYLYILEACTSASISKEQANELVLSVARFKDQVVLLEDPMRGVAPMLTALRKLQISSEQLTTLHPDFLLLCLLSKCYKAGLSILEDDIFDVDQSRDLFLYCYYGGMICIGQKKFRKALELLHNVVTAPMPIISAIAVEAYKKYILVSLIHLGQFSTSLPKYSSSAAQRTLKNFTQDNNLGLVKQVVSSMYKRNIQRLTQTYLTLSLQDIANTVQLNSPKEAEMHVLQMIQEGEIYATINQKDGMVRFLEDPEQYKTCEMIGHIDLSIQRIMMLSKKLTTMNEVMSCDPSYLGKVGKERQRLDFDDYDTVPSKFCI
ncbi:hypothetical protein DH2020_009519 [Rehmannia glutinosa]|uniref:COP9 signalosome complex subunit 3 n=1 Tax=Rehmannia glutinosa TaxID=99300 RepID=A0ABR0X6K0_REHGL